MYLKISGVFQEVSENTWRFQGLKRKALFGSDNLVKSVYLIYAIR